MKGPRSADRRRVIRHSRGERVTAGAVRGATTAPVATTEVAAAATQPTTRPEQAVDVVILEGWCVGAVAQGAGALREPVDDLERDEDPQGVWRTYVNDQLNGPYQTLFGRLNDLIMLDPPSFEVVAGWRGEQEAKLRARTGGGGMDKAALARFLQHYERLTRWILSEMPARADWVVSLDKSRAPFA